MARQVRVQCVCIGVHRGVLYHTPETQVESHLERSITNVWPKLQKIQRITLEANHNFARASGTDMATSLGVASVSPPPLGASLGSCLLLNISCDSSHLLQQRDTSHRLTWQPLRSWLRPTVQLASRRGEATNPALYRDRTNRGPWRSTMSLTPPERQLSS